MSEFIPRDVIRFSSEAYAWQDAVRAAGAPLVERGNVEPRYLDAMVQTVIEAGPYIVLAPKIAVPHARPEMGVLKPGISVLRVLTPVTFDVPGFEGVGDVELFFALAATDKTSHLGSLQKLAMLLGDDDTIESLLGATTPDELYSIIQQSTGEETGE